MTDTHQIQQDLNYVRQAVSRLDQPRRSRAGIYWIWAIYVLIAYPLKDFAPRAAGAFSSIGFFVCFASSAYVGYRYKKSEGVKPVRDRSGLFWWGGTALIVLCLIAMPETMPALRATTYPLLSQFLGQLAVIMVGIFYFLGGVHYDRNFLWLGPILCACGLIVGLVPHYGWTALGIVFALGLIGPTLFAPRPPAELPQIDAA